VTQVASGSRHYSIEPEKQSAIERNRNSPIDLEPALSTSHPNPLEQQRQAQPRGRPNSVMIENRYQDTGQIAFSNRVIDNTSESLPQGGCLHQLNWNRDPSSLDRC
jgi:hypothetical protein